MIRKVAPSAFASHYDNDPSRKGECAAKKRLFGDCSRYAVAPVHTRFDAVEWFVWDAEHPWIGEYGPEVIRQAASFEDAMAGFEQFIA
jgi:hypothetical protein